MRALLVPIAMVLALGCGPHTKGSGVARTDARHVAAFSKVDASGGLDVRVHVGGAPAVSVSGDDNIVPLVETEVSADRLRVGYKSAQNVDPKIPVRVDVTVPLLEAVSAGSGSHVTAEGVKADGFEIQASSGANARVSGTAAALALDASSGAQVDTGGLASKTATVHASSGVNVTVSATDLATGDASAGSNVTVLGGPRTRRIATSSGANVAYR